MAGLLRNLLTLLASVLGYGKLASSATVRTGFFVTPFDVGIATLKSDKYLQLAEAAQLDFVVRTGLVGAMLRQRCSFVNVSQLVRFARPIGLFARVHVDTEIAWWDDRCAYFSHRFSVGGQPHSHVWVKMKFKQGRLTLPPQTFIGSIDRPKPAPLDLWDRMLEQMPRT